MKKHSSTKHKTTKKKSTKFKIKKSDFWKYTTFICVILLIYVLAAGTGSVSEKNAGNIAINYINTNLLPEGNTAELNSITETNGVYAVDLSINGQSYTSYVTKDGKMLFTQEGIDMTKEVEASVETTPTQPQGPEDWTVFENELSADIKSKILSFETGSPETYEGRILEFKSFEEIPKTLIVFYSPGCGWCKKYYPVLLEAKEKYPQLKIYALELNDYRNVANKYGITGTPGNVINGKYKVSGYMPIGDLSDILNKLS
ncbi:hypothetical protein CEE44_04330 [Candidatus Woesearchaeota archaeon B3_Woes]|nr:MAG: hypothetical protein CEE44_04330 [Candidatus Woesearchaeota archaeon B3_Woes]